MIPIHRIREGKVATIVHMIDRTHTQLIDTLIRQCNGQSTPRHIVKQLQSFLNVSFDKSTKNNLQNYTERQLEKSNQTQMKDIKLRKIMQKKKDDLLASLVINKLKNRAWIELLFKYNVSNKEVVDESDAEKETNTTEPEDELKEDEIPTSMPSIDIYRDNLNLICRLDHDLVPNDFAPDLQRYRLRRKYRAKRHKAQREYPFMIGCLSNMAVTKSAAYSYLYTWSDDIQRLLKIKNPLTINEATSLVFKYFREHNLLRDNKFYPDDNTQFLLRNLNFEGRLILSFAERIGTEKIHKVGIISSDGTRHLDTKANDSNEDIIIPLSAYNVPEAELENRVRKMMDPKDVIASFPTLYHKKSKRKRKNSK